MQCLRNRSNAIKLGMKSMIKVLLACNVDEDDLHSKLLIDLLVTLRSIYRKQAVATIHKQSLKIRKIEENNSENFKTKQITLAT